MGESADKCSVFDGYGRLALLGMGNQCGEVFWFSVFPFRDIMCAFQSAGSCDINTVFVSSVRTRGNDTVTGKQDRTVETFKFFFLFPPGISIVPRQVFVFLQLRIVMCGKHFAVGIYVYSRTFGLFQQFFEVFQVVSADKNARIVADTDINFSDFGISVAACIRFVQLCHSGYAMFPCFQSQLYQLFHGNVITG